MEVVHRVGDYQCEECDFTAVHREELKCHIEATHGDGDSQCHECDLKAVKKKEAYGSCSHGQK